ncbi:MAG: hypothetical protein HYS27_11800 [Deltaproteobacteria bacterium]|nr:hypothetical protein [Deltaproteobacteria bacterium]
MTRDDKTKIYTALSAPFPEEAIERTDGSVTGRGYSTTGLKYQFVVNRLNDVLGLGGYRTEQTVTVRQSTTQKGRAVFEATCEILLQLGEWADGRFVVFAEAHGTGGHTSTIEADARKGAFTNGLKKAAAMLGCGRQAYEGTIDDDNVPAADDEQAPRRAAPQARPVASEEPAVARNRLTSKQLAALWALARKLDIDKVAFRNRVKERFGCTVEFLDRADASQIIGELSAKLGNGHARRQAEGEEVA